MCSITGGLIIVTAIAAVVNAAALIYDVRCRYRTKSVSFIQVPNKNEGGVEEFKTADSPDEPGVKVNKIIINADNSVEIESMNGNKSSYAKFIKWRGKK